MSVNYSLLKAWVICILVLLVGTGIMPVMSGFSSEKDFRDATPTCLLTDSLFCLFIVSFL